MTEAEMDFLVDRFVGWYSQATLDRYREWARTPKTHVLKRRNLQKQVRRLLLGGRLVVVALGYDDVIDFPQVVIDLAHKQKAE